jgi:hypothetical protein
MLVHLIHELIAAKLEDDAPAGARQSVEDTTSPRARVTGATMRSTRNISATCPRDKPACLFPTAREMLVHLIHELIAAKLEDDAPAGARQSVEDFVESILLEFGRYQFMDKMHQHLTSLLLHSDCIMIPEDENEDFVESIRKSDPAVVWKYEENHGKEEETDDRRVQKP